MLAKAHRISASEMNTLSRPTDQSRQSALVVFYFAKPAVKKVAVVVGKKVAKHAVVRNRLRRQLYTLVSSHLPSLPAGYYVVRVQPTAIQIEYATLVEQLDTAFGQIAKAR